MTSRDPASLSHPVTSHKRQAGTVFLPLPIYTSTARPKEQLTEFSTAKESGQSWPHVNGLTATRTEEQKRGPCMALLVPCYCRQPCHVHSVDQQAPF